MEYTTSFKDYSKIIYLINESKDLWSDEEKLALKMVLYEKLVPNATRFDARPSVQNFCEIF